MINLEKTPPFRVPSVSQPTGGVPSGAATTQCRRYPRPVLRAGELVDAELPAALPATGTRQQPLNRAT